MGSAPASASASTSRPPRPPLLSLPAHVVSTHVLPRLPASAIGRFACTCRFARDAAREDERLWRLLCARRLERWCPGAADVPPGEWKLPPPRRRRRREDDERRGSRRRAARRSFRFRIQRRRRVRRGGGKGGKGGEGGEGGGGRSPRVCRPSSASASASVDVPRPLLPPARLGGPWSASGPARLLARRHARPGAAGRRRRRRRPSRRTRGTPLRLLRLLLLLLALCLFLLLFPPPRPGPALLAGDPARDGHPQAPRLPALVRARPQGGERRRLLAPAVLGDERRVLQDAALRVRPFEARGAEAAAAVPEVSAGGGGPLGEGPEGRRRRCCCCCCGFLCSFQAKEGPEALRGAPLEPLAPVGGGARRRSGRLPGRF